MALPDGHSLLSGALVAVHSPQQSVEQHFALYAPPTLLPVPSSTCSSEHLGDVAERGACDAFCQPFHQSFLTDFNQVPELHCCADDSRFQEMSGHLGGNSVSFSGGTNIEDRVAARKLHKADREKLRRDKLNEQFTELAGALDPERPKNDKATILGESVQVVKELRAEVKRLKTEHTSLLNESRDLTEEKNELREEKAVLKNETEQLQNQLQQRLRTSSPWMALDPSVIMGAAAFPYPVPVPQPVPLSQSDSHQAAQRPLVTPPPYIPVPPPLGGFHMHPSFQAYAMFGNRHADGNSPYMPYPSFPPPLSSHSHIERPYAQYPSPVQPIPGYVVQMQPGQGSQPQMSASTPGAPIYRPCVAGIPVVSTQSHGSTHRSKGGSHRSHATQGSSQQAPTDSQLQITSSATASQSQALESVARSEPGTLTVMEEADSTLHHPEPSSSCPIVTSKLCKEAPRSSLEKGCSSCDHERGEKVEKKTQRSLR